VIWKTGILQNDIPFYLRNGFVPLNDEDADEPTRLLYFDLNDLDED